MRGDVAAGVSARRGSRPPALLHGVLEPSDVDAPVAASNGLVGCKVYKADNGDSVRASSRSLSSLDGSTMRCPINGVALGVGGEAGSG